VKRRRYRYDIALSYAGENEKFVRDVYRHLAAAKLSVFFAPRRTGELWGKDEREFQNVYGPESRFVVPFISEHYATKEWPQLEFRAARKEARKRAGDFLLPVRLDSTKMPGLPTRLQYVDGRRYSAREIARMLIDTKLRRRRQSPTGSTAKNLASVRILTAQDADLLGLIATTVFPLTIQNAQRLMPTIDWAAAVKRWRRQGLLQRAVRGRIEVTTQVRRELFASADAERRYHVRWTEVLTPLREYSDTALSLALHYASLRRVGDMLDVLIPIAESLEPGFWNDLYLGIFERFEKTTHLRTADVNAKIVFHNTYGLLLSRNERYADALAQFTKLRALSRRAKNLWGEGQSYINAGVAAAHSGDERAARNWYRKAITHARRHRDRWLLGRALGNLANFEDAETAARLLDESERIKLRVGDLSGLAGTLMARGNLAAAQGKFVDAARFYRRAEKLARRLDLRYVRTMALQNLGRTEVDRGRPKRAYRFYEEAQRIADAERFSDQLRHAVAGEALARAEAGEYRRAEVLFQRLTDLDQKRGDTEQAVISLHDVGAMRALQKRRADAFAIFTDVIAAAKKARTLPWIYRTQIDAAKVAPSDSTAVALLRQARPGALRAGDIERAVFCSVYIAEWHMLQRDPTAAVREVSAALRVAEGPVRVSLLADKFSLLLQLAASDRRLGAAFRELVRAAERAGDHARAVDAHMALGDHLWSRRTRAERANAYQAYVAALLPALRIDFETFLRVGMHASMRLHLLHREEDRMETLDAIEGKTRTWLERQTKTARHRVVELGLWPLRLARRILSRDDLGRGLTGAEMTKILTEEVERGVGFSLSKKRRTSKQSRE
jgi:tetratricopeptide (TPR) repeat protein